MKTLNLHAGDHVQSVLKEQEMICKDPRCKHPDSQHKIKIPNECKVYGCKCEKFKS